MDSVLFEKTDCVHLCTIIIFSVSGLLRFQTWQVIKRHPGPWPGSLDAVVQIRVAHWGRWVKGKGSDFNTLQQATSSSMDQFATKILKSLRRVKNT